MSEQHLQSRILKHLNEIKGCKAIKVPQDGYGEKGTPDILGCYLGQMFAIEVKAKGKKPTKIQELRLSEWGSAGALAVTIKEGDEFRVFSFLAALRVRT